MFVENFFQLKKLKDISGGSQSFVLYQGLLSIGSHFKKRIFRQRM